MSVQYLELGTEAWLRVIFVHCLAQKLCVCVLQVMHGYRGDKSGIQQNFSQFS